MTRILTVSDEVVKAFYQQSSRDVLGEVDILLGCGDLPYSYLEYLVTMLNVRHAYYVHGNHDSVEYLSNGIALTKPGGWVNIDRRVVTAKGLLIAGLEGSIRYRPHADYQYTQREMKARARRLIPRFLLNHLRYKRSVDIFIAHSPPAGIHDGPDGPHKGFTVFLDLIRRFRPRLFLHGHKHHYPPGPWKTPYESTTVVNVHPFRVIDIGEHDITYGRFYRR